uniref:Uncharacterized protein n=1 Tax=Panagrolaimus sp. PS1159 TaxID=55785 RepID=A0AC35FWC5_9BILA
MAFIGDLSGITERNKTNATYQSMIDGELMYEYAIYRFNKKETRATFQCAGCRSAISDGRAPEFTIYYLKGAVDFETKKVTFDENPDECLTKLNQKVKECEENRDHDGLMS